MLVEQYPVGKGIGHLKIAVTPGSRFDVRPAEGIVAGSDLLEQGIEFINIHEDLGAGRTITGMLAQVQYQILARHLHVKGCAGLKAMLPVDLHSEKIEIELPRFDFIKNA